MKDNIIQSKSFEFSLEIIDLYKILTSKKEFILSKQVLRSGTSIGANIEEAIGSYSKKEFISKVSIAYKEARETKYWLRLLFYSKQLDEEIYINLTKNLEEILRILGAIQKTSKNNIRNS